MTDSDFDETDAQLVLEVARARRVVTRLMQEIAEAHCTESIALVNLYKHRAGDAKKRNEFAEFDLGLARDAITSKSNISTGMSVIRRSNAKRPRFSSPSNRQSGSKRFCTLVDICLVTDLAFCSNLSAIRLPGGMNQRRIVLLSSATDV